MEMTKYKVKLDFFEGPLDLLLHLIKKNSLNIYDIPMALITQQYLEYIEVMKELNLHIAGEFLLMASTLVHIKSRMLLPAEEAEDRGSNDVEEDPRQELVERLLRYKQFKEAGENLAKREETWCNVFYRGDNKIYPDIYPLEVGLFELVEVLKELLKKTPHKMEIDIVPEEFSIKERMNEIIEALKGAGLAGVTIYSLVKDNISKRFIIATFLAILELAKLRLIKLVQTDISGPLRIIGTFI